MTIDECIKIWMYPTRYFPSIREEAMDFAIETMRKYKKIEEIMHIEMNEKEALQEIERVLRGGV